MARRQKYSYYRPEELRARIVRAGVGTALVLLIALSVLAPVLGLIGSVAAVGPVIDVPWVGLIVAVVVGLLLSIACLVGAFRTRRAWWGWLLVALAVLLALVASLWPLFATADAAVDRGRDVLPWIQEMIREFG